MDRIRWEKKNLNTILVHLAKKEKKKKQEEERRWKYLLGILGSVSRSDVRARWLSVSTVYFSPEKWIP